MDEPASFSSTVSHAAKPLEPPQTARHEPVKPPDASPTHHAPLGLRTVASFEFAKGLIVLVAGLGLLSLIGGDVQSVAEDIVRRLHLNPAHHYPRIFIQFASHITDTQLWFYASAALIYAGVRFVEAYGLWHERAWAEWFAVISATLYLPIELLHLYNDRSLVSFAVPIVNIGIVVYLAILLAANYRQRGKQDSNLDSP